MTVLPPVPEIEPGGVEALVLAEGHSLAEEAPNPATPYRRLMLALIASFGGGFIVNVVPVTLLLTLHLSSIAGKGATSAFSLVVGLAGFCGLIANPIAGRISDRTTAAMGRRRIWILLGGVTGGLVLWTMAFTTQVWQVALVWCIVQVLIQFQFASANAIVADQVPVDRRGSTSGAVGMIAAIAPVIGLGMVSAVSGSKGLQWTIVAVAGILGAVISVMLLKDPQHVRREGAPALNLKELAGSFWLSPRRHPAFAWAWVVRFLVTCAYASAAYLAFLLIERFGMTEAEVSKTVVGLTVTNIAFVATCCGLDGWLSDRLKRQKPFVIGGGIVAALGLAIMAFASTIPMVYLGVSVLGLGYGFFLATDFALCIRMLPDPENIGKDFAVLGIAGSLPASFVPLMAPLLLALGGYTALYLGIATLGLLGVLAVLRIPEIGHEGDPRWAQITVAEAVDRPVRA